jgi:hypothetical protein
VVEFFSHARLQKGYYDYPCCQSLLSKNARHLTSILWARLIKDSGYRLHAFKYHKKTVASQQVRRLNSPETVQNKNAVSDHWLKMNAQVMPKGTVAFLPWVPASGPCYKYSYDDLMNHNYVKSMQQIERRFDSIESQIHSLGSYEPIMPWSVK